jgi:hypothetical protein
MLTHGRTARSELAPVLLIGAGILPGMITLKAAARRHPEGASAASGLDCDH